MTGTAIGKNKDRLWCVLDDDGLFYLGGYKALNSTQENAGLAHGMRSSDNGKIKISYDISDYRAVSDEIDRLSGADLIAVVKALTESVIIAYDNGMMSIRNIVFDMDKVFIRGSSNKGFRTRLIYLPINVQSSMGGDDGADLYLRFLRELLQATGRVSVDTDIAALQGALDSSRDSLERFQSELSKLGGNPVKSDDPGPSGGGSGGSVSSGGGSSGGTSGGGGNVVRKPNTRNKNKERNSGRQQGGLSKKSLAIIIAQVCALAIGVAVFFLIGPLAVIAAVLADIIAVVIIVTLGSDRRKKTARGQEQVMNTSTLTDVADTEELEDFTPTVRLVGQNTPMMLKFVVEKAEFTIGRSSSCDGVIPGTMGTVSGHHCKILTENGTMYVMDHYESPKGVGSLHGTYINGSQRLGPTQKAKLQINDTLQLDKYRFKVEHI